MAEVEFTDNSAEILRMLEGATEQAAEIIGGKLVEWTKDNAPPKWGTELRDSYSHAVENTREGPVLSVGSNLEIAAYAELGTGKHYDPPPEWLANHVPKGTKVPAGIDHWIYFDQLEGVFKIGAPQVASPHLRPAFMDHIDDIRQIVQGEMENAQE